MNTQPFAPVFASGASCAFNEMHSLNPPPGQNQELNRDFNGPIRYIRNLDYVAGLEGEEKQKLQRTAQRFAFRSNSYYLSLIDWSDPNDPIRRIAIPCEEELEDWGRLDPSNEASYTVAPGCQHKYPHVAVLLVAHLCGGYCRFCFRKRLFFENNAEAPNDFAAGVQYIQSHPQITNVLVSGGDPLTLSTRKLRSLLGTLSEIKHVGVIRIGTKMPAFNPYRILDDPDLTEMVSEISLPQRHLYLMVHFNHPRELTPVACEALHRLGRAGAILCNQTPLIQGVNDDPETLADLFRRLSFAGVAPYYVFQCRPTIGNKPYAVPLERAFWVFQQARSKVAGVAKRARFVMSHSSGKSNSPA